VDLDGNIGFIDFEDDPCASLSLADAQMRDLLLFFYSCLLLMRNNEENVSMFVREFLQRYPQPSRHRFFTLMKRLRWLKRVPAFGFLGRDFVQMQYMVEFFQKDIFVN